MTAGRGRRTCIASAFFAFMLVAGGCGGEKTAGEPSPAAASAGSRPGSEPDPPDLATAEEMAELRLANEVVAALHRQCAPQRGTARDAVEVRFGEGRPTTGPKGFRDGPADSSCWVHLLDLPPLEAHAASATLVVFYDEEWAVLRSIFRNPYMRGGGLFYSEVLPRSVLRRHLQVSRRMAEHLERVRAELHRRFGD